MNEEVAWFNDVATYHAEPEHQMFELPILFIHGAWGGKYQFKKWQHYAAERGWESYAIDLRGHYETKANDLGTISIQDYARDIESVIEQIGPCYLVGHSMGGLLAQVIASRNVHVKKAVFVASTPPAGIVFVNALVIGIFRYMPAILGSKPYMLTKEDAFRFLFNGSHEKELDLLVPDSGRAARQILFGRIWVTTPLCPCLVVGAERDQSIPVNAERRIARKYGSEYVEIEGAEHMLMLGEKWESAIKEILAWLGKK